MIGVEDLRNKLNKVKEQHEEKKKFWSLSKSIMKMVVSGMDDESKNKIIKSTEQIYKATELQLKINSKALKESNRLLKTIIPESPEYKSMFIFIFILLSQRNMFEEEMIYCD